MKNKNISDNKLNNQMNCAQMELSLELNLTYLNYIIKIIITNNCINNLQIAIIIRTINLLKLSLC